MYNESGLEKLVQEHQVERQRLALREPAWDLDTEDFWNSLPVFQEAEEIIQHLKELELSRLFRPGEAQGEDHGHVHQFMRAKVVIGDSHLAQLMDSMPKGAPLHCHLEAMLSPRGLLEFARTKENLYIKTSHPLSSSQAYEGLAAFPQLQVLSRNVVDSLEDTNIFSLDYEPGAWMLYSSFRTKFPGGEQAAETWLLSKMVLSAQDVYKSSQTIDGIWQVFLQSFLVIRGLLYYESAWKYLWDSVMRALVKENIQYAEIRFVLGRDNLVISDDGTRELAYDEMLDIIQTSSQEEILRCESVGKVFYGIKIIYTQLRRCDTEEMEWAMENCIKLKQKYPNLICGFDMVGQEDAGYSLNHWLPQLLQMQSRCEQLGLAIPFLFHAGETHNTRGDADSNVHDAIILGSRRIGHGYQLAKHPALQEICRDRQIAVEVCPISHEVLGLCTRIATHPIQQLLAAGVPCVIGSDDPGFWKSNLLADDFYQILTRIPKMTLRGLYTMVHWSFKYSMISEDEKGYREGVLKEQWKVFCADLVQLHRESLSDRKL